MSDESSSRVATPELVRQLVRDIRGQLEERPRPHPEPLVIAARAQPRWNGPAIDDTRFGRIEVAACVSPLAARRALADFTADSKNEHATLVVLTDVPERALGTDLLGRFVRPKLYSLSPWDAVRQRFGVPRLDPDFAKPQYSWMSDVLLDVPVSAVPPGAAVLSVDAALRAVTEVVFGATGTSVERLLVASATPGFAERVQHADERIVTELCTSLATLHGNVGALVLGAIARGHGEQALPAGLAARTLVGSISGHYAQAKIEQLTGVDQVSDQALDAWARAAELAHAELAATGNPAAVQVAFIGSALVSEWLAPHPDASDVLAASFEARLAELGTVLESMLDKQSIEDAAALRSAITRVLEHREATTELGRPRAQRAQLAARLVSWLRDPISAVAGTGAAKGDTPPSLVVAAAAYLNDGAWVDAARRRVGEGDDSPEPFRNALQHIAAAAHERRATGNRSFGTALANWTTNGSSTDLTDTGLHVVESILNDVVAPLAKHQPVLLVVLDGCGLPAFLELADQFRQLGLTELGKGADRQIGLAALPTVTEVSRTSLLCGTLRVGTAADESKEFPKHPKLAKFDGPAPVLFHHRPDLVSGVGQGLPPQVLAALSASGPRVVGAVVNTIDDELSRGDFTPEYRIENLGPLPALLRAAVDAGRLVIVTADHGHVLGVGLDGKGKTDIKGEGGERWRVADQSPSDDEVLLRGERVLHGGDAGVRAPWHDDLRYSAKKGGYHGGATPDECLVPLSVFAPIGVELPNGWTTLSTAPPAWWDLHVESVPSTTPPPAPKKPAKKAPPANQDSLFVVEQPAAEVEPAASTAAAVPASAPWIDEVLVSETYAVQLGAITRGKPTEDRVRTTLSALHSRGGVASFAVLTQATGMPPARIPGFVTSLERLLNVDGYGVITVDRSAQELRLDEALLRSQFLSTDA